MRGILWLGLLCGGTAVFSSTPGAAPARADVFGGGAIAFEIEFVTIGQPRNALDATGNPSSAGSVNYSYRMGKYEISERVIEKASSLGGLGITKDARGPDKPATNVDWFEAARFVNWLNTSTGHAAAYKFDSGGAFELWSPADVGYQAENRYRNRFAKYFLPSTDEWYKAAYYDPVTARYYDYPTGSDSLPDGLDFVGDPNFDAVFAEERSIDEPNDIFDAGLVGPYGTVGQGGNVYEWEETDYDLVNDNMYVRGLRGGAFRGSVGGLALSSSLRTYDPPWIGDSHVGFRIASIVPEPTPAAIVAAPMLLLCFLKVRCWGNELPLF